MTCRDTPSGSAFTSYARLVTGRVLTDPETLSAFHELRALYRERDADSRRVYTREDYDALLDRQTARVSTMPGVSDDQRTDLLRRLTAARAADMPEQSIVYALHNITPTVRTRGANIAQFQREIATRTGMSADEVRQAFREYTTSVDRSPAARSRVRTQTNLERAAQHGMGRETGVLHAVAMLTEQAEQVEIARARQAPQRIERATFDVPAETGIMGISMREAGYDARNGRLEVSVQDSVAGDSAVHVYRGVPDEIGRSVANGDADAWYRWVRGHSEYAYPSEHAAALDGAAPRCAACGQFANAAHACSPAAAPGAPTPGDRRTPLVLARWRTRSRWSNQAVPLRVPLADGSVSEMEVRVSLPAIRELREGFAAGPVRISNIYQNLSGPSADGRWRWTSVTGDAEASRDPDTNAITVDTSQLRCNCPQWRANGHCEHVDLVASAIRTRLDPPPRSARSARTPEERERLLAEQQRRAEVAAANDWTRQEATLAEARATWRGNAEVLYSEDFAAFQADYDAALAAREAKNGVPQIPLIMTNALDGMATRGSGQGFGPELEYEFPDTMDAQARREANARIGQELYAAGLTSVPEQQLYGTARRRGVRDTLAGNFSFENDGSVNGGEIVCPIMYDEEETWQAMTTLCDILRRNGAQPSRRAGAHVHVGTGIYGGDPAKYAELARLVNQHEDVMFRLAACPERGTHRLGTYTRPNPPVPEWGFASISATRSWQGGRMKALNFNNVDGGDADHAEFRIFDSSLDPGTIQAQVKLAVAMTQAAAAHAEAGGTSRAKEPLGSHAQRARVRGRRRMTQEDLAEDTATLRSLLDTLFRRREDKAQLTAVFANTKWSPSRG